MMVAVLCGLVIVVVAGCCPAPPVELELQADFDYPVLTVSANRPLSIALLQEYFCLEPELPLELREADGAVEIVPINGWPAEADYTLTVRPFTGPDLALAEPFRFSFRTPPPPTFRLTAVGDVMLDYLTSARVRRYDPAYPFARVAAILQEGDLVFANLESPISHRGVPMDKLYAFRAFPFAVEALLHGGINLVSLANNHILDYGVEAFLDTLAILDKHSIVYAGAGLNEAEARRGARLEINGIKVAVLAYAGYFHQIYPLWQAGPDKPGMLFYYGFEEAFKEDIRAARAEADVVIVSMHWGDEYTYRVNREQREMGRLAVDSGADLVLGHHSHTPQGIEIYRGKPIVYSLGNFIFYPFANPICNEAFILHAEICSNGVKSMRLLPVLLGDSQPYVPTGAELARMQRLLGGLLDEFSTPWEIDGAELVITINSGKSD